ncbi:23S rRNA (uracil(1939)-C(5))-methyltransferase RlmD [candidate division BRC1 bacterium HGW-BRC1-1]|jgi:23S rRNA (uracil1939-C5)-methyltransferase|nr:MAG: 23S rRNA (uracil(1939)-C(5))-methyltransferase RlmD [candidate division BRC1 bacterium HGW-BRC1-1]
MFVLIMTANEIRKGDEVELSIDSLAFGGRGVARHAGMVIFVEGALEGDVVRARITKRKPQYAEARATEVVTPSPHRLEAPCPVFGICGGCKWQNFEYARQLEAKQRHVGEALTHIARRQQVEVRPIIASPSQWHYRNKMEFSFGPAPGGRVDIGLHAAGRFEQIIDVPGCLIAPQAVSDALDGFREMINHEAARAPQRFLPYHPKSHEGFLRHLIFRYSHTTGHWLAALLTAGNPWPGAEDFALAVMKRFPMCRGFIWGTNDSLSDVARMEHQRLQLGDGFIEERLGDKTFRVSTFSFFQTNTAGAELLYDVVRDFCELTGRETVLDAYCGTGTIGIYVASQAERVVGIELVRDAVWDARYNARENGADNCTFFAGDMREVMPSIPKTMGVRFDRVIVDPPRGGMEKRALRQLIDLKAPLMVYVSCNPATLARDLVQLAEAGYNVEAVQPVDMFPHTWHVESVLKLRLGEKPNASTQSHEDTKKS